MTKANILIIVLPLFSELWISLAMELKKYTIALIMIALVTIN